MDAPEQATFLQYLQIAPDGLLGDLQEEGHIRDADPAGPVEAGQDFLVAMIRQHARWPSYRSPDDNGDPWPRSRGNAEAACGIPCSFAL
jgi:hypothetical protein